MAAQSPAMKVSAKPMSPERSTALHSVQLCRRTAACGSPVAPLPNRAWLPSGSCTSSVPYLQPAQHREHGACGGWCRWRQDPGAEGGD